MKNVLILDVETTIKNKGNPFDRSNKLVCVGFKWVDNPYPSCVYLEDKTDRDVQEAISQANLIVGFNIKFDLHWLRNIGIDISNIKVWDCQLAEFILNNQKTPYPSLDQAADKYGFNKKMDVVKLEYWDKGIDTTDIPRNILSNYLEQDLNLTEQVYLKQKELFEKDNRYSLFRLHCSDLLVLEEMEYNGIKFNTQKALTKAEEVKNELNSLHQELSSIIGNIPFNPNSADHVSCILYGGTIVDDVRIPVGEYKTGDKKGQTRYKIIEKEYELPRLCEPIDGTETKKSKERSKETGVPTYWEVNETVLRKLKLNNHAKKIVTLLRKYSELEKLCGTYLEGYSKLISEMNWPENTLHGTLNQCVVITGRLSSTKPNLQNADPTTKIYMETRY